MSEWKPIESAPKDGTPIIIAITGGPNGPIVGEARWYWEGESFEDAKKRGDWWWAGTQPEDFHHGPVSEINFGDVNHWMPLPEPPE